MPGLAELTGARVLAEIGDDRDRFADARGLKAYAGSAPVTRASGKTTAVLHRRVKNQRLASSATSGLRRTDRLARRPRPLRPAARTPGTATSPPNAICSPFWLLHHCLHTHQTYDEAIAFPPRQTPPMLVPLDKIKRGMSSSHQGRTGRSVR